MSEYDFRDNLVTIARFGTPLEASLALARLEQAGIVARVENAETANWMNHVGSSLIGAELSVKQRDLEHAKRVLAEVSDHRETRDESADDEEDWLGEDWADDDYDEYDDTDDDDDYEPYSEAPPVTPPLTRAFRAAVIGIILLPPLLNMYSIALIVYHELWKPLPGKTHVDWRLPMTLVCNVFSLLVARWLYYFVFVE